MVSQKDHNSFLCRVFALVRHFLEAFPFFHSTTGRFRFGLAKYFPDFLPEFCPHLEPVLSRLMVVLENVVSGNVWCKKISCYAMLGNHNNKVRQRVLGNIFLCYRDKHFVFFKQGEFTIFTTAKRLTAESHPKNFPPEGLFVFYLFICAQDRLNAERKSVPFCMVILYF